MLNSLAQILNDYGNASENRGRHQFAKFLYRSAARVCPKWGGPWYNLGLQAKYRCDWQSSFEFNKKAAELDPKDESSNWNLGIAATALRDWETAWRAWKNCGIELEERGGEVVMPPTTACVRLNPEENGEVVWGTRIDPARIQIQNVPLPNSGRRYRDILLNDGAEAGTRKSGEYEYPVFDELAVWQKSGYSTFQSTLTISDANAEEVVLELCRNHDIGAEDWGSVRVLCAACSNGSPGESHHVDGESSEGSRNYGFGCASREVLVEVLTAWKEEELGRSFSDPHLVLLSN